MLLGEGARFGPFEALATPGHAVDHIALIADGACFTGDAVLGEGSVFISPHPGAMAGYLLALDASAVCARTSACCAPATARSCGTPTRSSNEYVAHRIDRENGLILALGEGRRTIEELLDAVWPEIPEQLRPPATATLAAHLDKLEEEQILPTGVERPNFKGIEW